MPGLLAGGLYHRRGLTCREPPSVAVVDPHAELARDPVLSFQGGRHDGAVLTVEADLALLRKWRFNGVAKAARAFNAQTFLESAGVAKTIVQYGRGDAIFTQGDACEHVMYNQAGGVKLSVLSKTVFC